MRTGIDQQLKNTLVASLAPADSNGMVPQTQLLTKNLSSAKNERGRASMRGMSNQISEKIKSGAPT